MIGAAGAVEPRRAASPRSAPTGSRAPSGVGKPIRVRLADGELDGRFEALDETGRLVLRCADGAPQAIAAGDVLSVAGEARS